MQKKFSMHYETSLDFLKRKC